MNIVQHSIEGTERVKCLEDCKSRQLSLSYRAGNWDIMGMGLPMQTCRYITRMQDLQPRAHS